jgi:pilus assembly protein CpaB
VKAKTIVPLVLGLGVGAFAVKMGVDMVQKAKGAQGAETLVYVATTEIEVASRVTESMLGTVKTHESIVPTGAFTKKADLIDRVTKMSIPTGVTITDHMLSPPGAEPGLRALIPAGHRAVSVSVTEESAVAGFITPGSRVDVSTVNKKENSSKQILTDVMVGAVGQSLNEAGNEGQSTRITKSVTLFLKPHEVQILNANNNGFGTAIRLSLRGNSEESNSDFWKDMLANAAQAVPQQLPTPEPTPKPKKVKKPKPVNTHVIDVWNGPELERVVFDDHGGVKRLSAEQLMAASERDAPGGSVSDDDDTDYPESFD